MARIIGTVDSITTTAPSATAQRCSSDQTSIFWYGRAKTFSYHPALVAFFSSSTFRKREHSIGVSVKETISETPTANAAV